MSVFDRAMSLCAEAKPGDVIGSITLVKHLCKEPDSPDHDHDHCMWLIQCTCGRQSELFLSYVMCGWDFSGQIYCRECHDAEVPKPTKTN
jgi:hypothetical protein